MLGAPDAGSGYGRHVYDSCKQTGAPFCTYHTSRSVIHPGVDACDPASPLTCHTTETSMSHINNSHSVIVITHGNIHSNTDQIGGLVATKQFLSN